MKKLAMVVTVAALVVLGAVSMAAAGSRDGNRDRIPDKWEKRFGLSLQVKQTRRDQDHDGLNNLGEFRAGTSPRDRDSDDDGTRDGKENAGTVESFDGTTLVITLFGGGRIEGKVTTATRLKCENEDGDDRPTATSSERGAGSSDDDDEGRGDDDRAGDDDDSSGSRDGGDRDRTCPAGALTKGATVEEAELEATRDGLVYEEVELEN